MLNSFLKNWILFFKSKWIYLSFSKTSKDFKAPAATHYPKAFEKRYGLHVYLRVLIISLFAVINPPFAFPKTLPSEELIISTLFKTSSTSTLPLPLYPRIPIDKLSSTIINASYLSAKSQIYFNFVIVPYIGLIP